MTGVVYCNTIAFCRDAYELCHAREWTEALTRWCERQPELVAHNGLFFGAGGRRGPIRRRNATCRSTTGSCFLERIEQLPDVVARRRRSYELLALRPDDRVADMGCGLGTAARELAALGFRVIGFDASEAMVAEARRRSDAGSVEFALADVSALPLEDGALAGYRAERLYQHLADPGAALAEAWRVLAPGGHLVLVDQDWDAFLIDGDPKDVTRTVMLGFSDSIRNGWIGRSYHRLLTDTGFVEVAVHPETVAITSPEQGERLPKLAADAAVEAGAVDATVAGHWLDDQRARLEAGTFFAAMTHFTAVARRPS